MHYKTQFSSTVFAKKIHEGWDVRHYANCIQKTSFYKLFIKFKCMQIANWSIDFVKNFCYGLQNIRCLTSVPNSLKLCLCWQNGLLSVIGRHKNHSTQTFLYKVRKSVKTGLFTLFHKNGHISSYNRPIWNIKSLAYSGEQARPAGWTGSNSCSSWRISIHLGQDDRLDLEHWSLCIWIQVKFKDTWYRWP